MLGHDFADPALPLFQQCRAGVIGVENRTLFGDSQDRTDVLGGNFREHANSFFRLLSLSGFRPKGDILRNTSSRIFEWNDRRIHPIWRAVFCPIVDLAVPDPPRRDRLPHFSKEGAGAMARTNNPMVLPEKFLP